MAFFFKSFPTITELKTEVKSDTELVPEDCTAAETLKLSTCEECGFKFVSDAYREDHKKWHEHISSKKDCTSAQPRLPTTERSMYFKTPRSAVGIKTEKPNDDTTAGVTLPAMTCQPQNPLKPFACEYCGWRFILRKDLVHHVRTHTGEKPYACSDCGRQFARVHSLNLHRGRHNSSEEGKPYSCTRCPKRFWTKGCYMSHYKSNHEDWPQPQVATLQVESAAESFSAEDNQEPDGSLNINDTLHNLYLPQSTGAASFDDDCTSNLQNRSTESNQVDALFSATPLGGGKRGVRFTCQYCGWGFWDKKDRKQHEWTHTGLKPYQCKECGKNFSRSYTLKLHMRAHAGEKPFSCQFCNKTFTGCGSLRLHTKIHTKVHKHKCPECPMSFKRMDLFKIHQKEHLSSNYGNFARLHSSCDKPDTSPSVQNEGVVLHPVSLSLTLPVKLNALNDSIVTANDISTIYQKEHFNNNFGSFVRLHSSCNKPDTSSPSVQNEGDALHPVSLSLTPPAMPNASSDSIGMANDISNINQKKHLNSNSGNFAGLHSCDKPDTPPSVQNVGDELHPVSLSLTPPAMPNASSDSIGMANDISNINQKKHLNSNTGNFAGLHSFCDKPDTPPSVQNVGDELHPVRVSLTPPVMQNASNDSIGMANDISNIMLAQQDGTVRAPCIKEVPFVARISRNSPQDCNENEKLVLTTLPCASPGLQWKDQGVLARICSKPISGSQRKHLLTGGRSFACRYCNATFRDHFGRNFHEQTHTCNKSPSFECRICKEAFKQQSSLVRHLRSHKKEKMGLNFESYPAETHSEILAETHVSRGLSTFDDTRDGASKAKTIYESQTTVVTQKSVDVQGTMQNIDGVQKSKDSCKRFKRPFRFKCSYCPRRFRDKKDWRQHDNTHTGFKPYSCSVCGRKLSRQYSLKKHMMTHTGEKPVSCAYCNKAFRNKSGLLCHQKKHHPWVFEHTCCLCKTAHKNTDALECHLRSDHDDVIRTVVNQFLIDDHGINAPVDSSCLSSPKQSGYREQTNWADMEDIAVKYLSKRERRIDQAVAVAIDLWLKCEGCEMITEILKFKCSFCDKGFQNRKDWERHENSHTGYKPYVCDICGKRVSRLNSLKAHRQTHSITPTYVCRHCGKGFRKQLSLVKHEASENCTSFGTKLKTITIELDKQMADHEDVYQNLDTDVYVKVPLEPPNSLQEMDSAELDQPSSTFCSSDSISRMPSCSFKYQCAHCKWKFSDMDIFRRHGCWQRRLLGKTRMKHVSCDNCKEMFRTKKTLDIHMRTCRSVCNICHESFTTNNALGRHLQLIHPHNTANQLGIKREKSDSTSECTSAKTVCDTPTASDVSDLNSGRSSSIHHSDDAANSVLNQTTDRMCMPVKIPVITTHSKRLIITCRICQKNFTHRYALKLHLMMHASETRYQCRLCHKRFFYKKGLKKHLQNHRPQQRRVFATDAKNSDDSLI